MFPKPLKLPVFVSLLLLPMLWAPQALAVDVNLAWDAVTTYTNGAAATDLAGYRLYYWQGTQVTGTPLIINVGKQTPYATVPGLVAGAPYTFAVAGYNTAGNEGVRAFLTVTISSVNHGPVAGDDPVSTPMGTETIINVLGNDTDADGNALTITAVTPAAHGTVAIIDSGNSLRYTPAAGYDGDDSFTYTISDGQGGVDTARVTVTVLPNRAASLVAAYNFNEGTGTTVTDRSGHSNTGTTRGTTWTTAGKFGGALVFNGTDAWVTVADAASLRLTTAMTLAAWVFPTTTTGKRDILLKEGTNVDIYNLYARNEHGQPESNVFVGGTNRIAQGGGGLAANVWTHVAGTYDGATLRLFLNGVQVASTTVSGAVATSTGPLRIGGNSIWGEFFQGRIDEVRIYNDVLTAAEILADMNLPLQ